MPSLSILLVDDAPDIGLIVQRYARRAGQSVVVAPDAESAWKCLRDGPRPELVVLDINLPGASGTDLCRSLRADPKLRDLPVALFSQWQRPEDIAAGVEAGADFVLCKDLLCQPDAWHRRLGEILSSAAGRRPPPTIPCLHTFRPDDLVARLNRWLRGPASATLGVAVVLVLVRRIWPTATGTAVPADLALPAVASSVAALTDQIWRLLGTEASAPLWAALAADLRAARTPTPDEATAHHPSGRG